MSDNRPTLNELRERAQKGRHREIGNILARRYARPTAIYGTWLAVRLGLTAHHVTLLALGSSLGAAIAIGTGVRIGFIAGVALIHLAFWLDHVDGQVARWRRTASLDGVYFDYLMHHAAGLALGFSLGFGLAVRSDNMMWAVAGFAISMGWAFLSLHNDCRYKAFFQRLKSVDGSFRIEGGGGGRPASTPPPPRQIRHKLVWLAYKWCESHIVLIGLTGLAGLALVAPVSWELCWKGSTTGMAIGAPILAAARVSRSIGRAATEEDFSRWFRPDVPGLGDRPSVNSRVDEHSPNGLQPAGHWTSPMPQSITDHVG